MADQNPVNEEQVHRSIVKRIGDFFYDLFNIRKGLDWVGTVTSIRNKVDLKGENIWMLICSIMIASVGLNLNSGAVIIGAMLISPLMSPILGIGLGIAINDRDLMIRAIKSFSIATIFAIITSVFYFKFLTPFKEPGSEIISRTTPTVLDAIVAIFGGIAGIVATSRKDKGAAIPGVAIATALLPPLAVSGYGLANGIYVYFTHAFYLFFLNSMLIAFATFLIVRYLGFPMKEHQSPDAKRRASVAIGISVIALLIPGVLILNQLLKEKKRTEQIELFFQQRFDTGENQLFGEVIPEYSLENDTVVYYLSYRGEEVDSLTLANYQQELSNITNSVSYIDPTLLNLSKAQIDRFERRNSQTTQQLEKGKEQELAFKQEINTLEIIIDSLKTPSKVYKSMESEITALWPEIDTFAYGEVLAKQDSSYTNVPTFLYNWKAGISSKDKLRVKNQLNRYLDAKLNNDEFNLIQFE